MGVRAGRVGGAGREGEGRVGIGAGGEERGQKEKKGGRGVGSSGLGFENGTKAETAQGVAGREKGRRGRIR